MAKKSTQPEEVVDPNLLTKNLLQGFLEDNKEDHYNFVPNSPTKVSMGSLFLDAEIALTEGIHRFTGSAGAGKTSQALVVVRNFLADEPKRKALWVKAEGRLSENLIARSGIKFVYTAEEWEYGTCFVVESNTFEFICKLIDSTLTIFHENGIKLAIVIDSVDGLKLKADANNDLGSERTMGPQLIMKRFLIRESFPIIKYGAICIAISQVTATMTEKGDAPKLTSGGGGNALLHWSNYILEFSPRWWGDNILEGGPNTKFDADKNPIVGHFATVKIKKTDKENENTTIKYPIKHGRTNGNSIWVEHELITFLKRWNMIESKGPWTNFTPELIKDAEIELKITIEPKHQGFNNFLNYLESTPALVKYLYDRIRLVESK